MSWTQWDDQVFEMLGRLRSREGSRAASAVGKECQMIVSPNRNKSKAASVPGVNKIKVIANYLNKSY